MTDAKLHRLRLCLFPEDDLAIELVARSTSQRTKSRMIRSAVTFLDQIWTSKLGGFSVVFRRPGRSDAPGVLESALSPRNRDTAQTGRRKSSGAVEVRISPADDEKINRLLGTGGAETYAEAIRRALRVYAAAVARCREGWEVVARSPSGDVLPFSVPGLSLGAAADVTAATERFSGKTPVRELNPRMDAILPKSLIETLHSLAAHEGCDPEVLLVDLVRAEAQTRLGRLGESAVCLSIPSVPDAPCEAGQEIQIEAEPVLPSVAAPSAEQPDLAALAEALGTIATHVEEAIQAMGPAKQKDTPLDFEDLFSAAGPADPPAALEKADGSRSPMEQLLVQVRQLDERLGQLAALAQRGTKSKAAKTGRAARKSAQSEEEGLLGDNGDDV